MLGLSIADGPTEERDCKRGTIGAGGPCCVKIVFTLLRKVITVHVRFFIIKVGEPGPQRTLLRLLRDLFGTHTNPQKLL